MKNATNANTKLKTVWVRADLATGSKCFSLGQSVSVMGVNHGVAEDIEETPAGAVIVTCRFGDGGSVPYTRKRVRFHAAVICTEELDAD